MLHIVNKSPYDRNNLASCLRLAKKQSAILLIEDAVYAVLADGEQSHLLNNVLNDYQLFVLEPDLRARGLVDKPLIKGIKQIDYDGFVELTEQQTNIQSWL